MIFFSLLTSNSPLIVKLIVALSYLFVAMFSITLHECAHGYAALLSGDRTAKDRGRLTLNPVEHFNLFGLLMMFAVGFGWAKPVPVNSSNFTNYKKGMIFVSVAGVATNAAIAGISLLLLYLSAPLFAVSYTSYAVTVVVIIYQSILILGVRLNLMLAMFNLLPIYPLDGFNLVNTFLPAGNGYQRFMVKYGMFVLIGIIAIGSIGTALGLNYLNIFTMWNNVIQKLLLLVIK